MKLHWEVIPQLLSYIDSGEHCITALDVNMLLFSNWLVLTTQSATGKVLWLRLACELQVNKGSFYHVRTHVFRNGSHVKSVSLPNMTSLPLAELSFKDLDYTLGFAIILAF